MRLGPSLTLPFMGRVAGRSPDGGGVSRHPDPSSAADASPPCRLRRRPSPMKGREIGVFFSNALFPPRSRWARLRANPDEPGAGANHHDHHSLGLGPASSLPGEIVRRARAVAGKRRDPRAGRRRGGGPGSGLADQPVDLGLLLGPADISTARVGSNADGPVVTFDIPQSACSGWSPPGRTRACRWATKAPVWWSPPARRRKPRPCWARPSPVWAGRCTASSAPCPSPAAWSCPTERPRPRARPASSIR